MYKKRFYKRIKLLIEKSNILKKKEIEKKKKKEIIFFIKKKKLFIYGIFSKKKKKFKKKKKKKKKKKGNSFFYTKKRIIDIWNFFPNISKNRRAVPNTILRSSLFGILKKGCRKYERNILKTSLNNFFIRFTGEQLDQSDLDVWLECLYRFSQVPLGGKVVFSSYSFLKSINRTTGKKDYEWLKSSLIRLSICSIEISYKNHFYIGHLLHEWYRNDKTKKNIILLNENITSFFTHSIWTIVSLKERKKLKGRPLSQWIHCFYCTHNIPLCYKVTTLKKLCGSKIIILWKFRQILKKSLQEVSVATGWDCWIDKNDIVHVIKK
ncbi:hypothetical protein GJT99_02225 (plasmid) [Enterobacteriaceae endosymbiont of Donacia cincticornis]|uniref:plasmid replication initiator TrfA n=1 Tax=Enterobacteriaceae endosymbiont of Donacia cincticornis TaxID=2675773 RepID=UPI00144A23D8|nr:plasmid replication initiator TrfA [Enterobacteriaceae endosymbiont of Donacia cincticornis]QJC36320.1 hypothetical protein GJT99_02225 [Enterobacteriaceae endosymbiont of Donacia cincticornis]